MKLGECARVALVLGVSLLGAGPARAQTAIEEAARPLVRPPVWEVEAGVRTMYVKSAGYDPFSTDDALAQFSLAGTRALLRRGGLALVAGVGLDVGGSSATARGAPSSLTLTRVSALVEGRYQPAARLYLFARLAPGLLHGAASIDDVSTPGASSLSTSFDAFSLDAGGGAALCFGDVGSIHLGAWLVADGGYGWVAAQDLVLAPSLGSDQSKAGALDLGTLAPRGGFFRLSLALSY
ncbi:MAG TPA: hypothetical protein VKZ18_26430 [Polyangia bacterium]|nr:hypothetical protein [Polyangia bacterium]